MNLTVQAYNSYQRNNQNSQNVSFQSVSNGMPRFLKRCAIEDIQNYQVQMTEQGMQVNTSVIRNYMDLATKIHEEMKSFMKNMYPGIIFKRSKQPNGERRFVLQLKEGGRPIEFVPLEYNSRGIGPSLYGGNEQALSMGRIYYYGDINVTDNKPHLEDLKRFMNCIKKANPESIEYYLAQCATRNVEGMAEAGSSPESLMKLIDAIDKLAKQVRRRGCEYCYKESLLPDVITAYNNSQAKVKPKPVISPELAQKNQEVVDQMLRNFTLSRNKTKAQ